MSIPLLQKIASAYDALPSGRIVDPLAERSYAAFRLDIIRLYRTLPVCVEPWVPAGQPYSNSAEMFADLDANRRLFVYTGGGDHPYLSREENVMFRAVHDCLGHYLGRFPFGPRGELNAWKVHLRQFTEDAIPAMTTETLGQNCWVNYGPFAHLPPSERPYAEQKAGLLQEEFWLPLIARPGDVSVSRPAWRFPNF